MSGLHPQYMLSKRFPVHAAIELQDLKTIASLLGNPKDARYHFDRKLINNEVKDLNIYSGQTLKWCMTFVLIIRTSKHFWLLQCIWHLTRVTYPWFITNCSHWNHCIWSQELWEHKFLDLKKVLLFYRSMLRLSSQRSCKHLQWFSGCKW